MRSGSQLSPTPLAIAQLLREIASGLKLTGESRFRINAYERGADAIESFSGNLAGVIAAHELTALPGIGEKLAGIIEEMHATGTSTLLTALRDALPPGALALARGPALSMRAIRTLSEAGIRSVEALEAAARAGKLRALRGFSAKTEARILTEPAAKAGHAGGTRLADALALARHVAAFMNDRKNARSNAIDLVGDARRGVEVVDVVELLSSSDDPARAIARFERYPRILALESTGDHARLARLAGGDRVSLRAVLTGARGAALQRLTGSADHNDALDRAAKKSGIAITDDGLFTLGEQMRKSLPTADERDVYARANVEYVPPEIRDDTAALRTSGEAERDHAPLIALADVRGMVHCHTHYSDGRHSIEEMAMAAQKRGMKYLTITDHSPTAHYANGVTIDRLHAQWDEIARVQERVDIRILRGTECDILKDGELDYPDAILDQLDVIIASIHNRYRLDRAAMTARIVRALRHPLCKVWGHAFGRLLLNRPPVECDVDAILEAAAESNVVIELNGDPYRMDMPPLVVRRARALGIPFVVSVDAHSTRDYDNCALGVTMARRAGLTAAEVVNTFDVDAFVDAVKPSRTSGAWRGCSANRQGLGDFIGAPQSE